MRGKRTKRNGGDEQVEILRAIWSEMKGLNGRIDQTNERLDQTNQRLEQTNQRLDAVRSELKDEMDVLRRRLVESEVRLGTATTQLSSDVQELSGLIRGWREEHRADRAELAVRVARIEGHLGLGAK